MHPGVRAIRLVMLLALLAAPGRAAPPALDGQAAACAGQLWEIGRALAAYRRDRGELPPHLSDLCPRYIADPSVLLCPADPETGATGVSGVDPDPKPVSYLYEMSLTGNPGGLLLGPVPQGRAATWRDWKTAQRVQYGDRVPVVSCWHHRGQGYRLNLTLTGRVYPSETYWELDPETAAVVLDRMERDLGFGLSRFRKCWRPDALAWYCFALTGRVPAATRRHLRALAVRLSALGQAQATMDGGAFSTAAGSMWYAGGETKRAILAYESAVRRPGKHQETARLLLANLYRDIGRPGLANRIVRQLPVPPRASIRWMRYLATAYASAGLTDRAGEWRSRADAWGPPAERWDQQSFIIAALVLLAALVAAVLGTSVGRSRRRSHLAAGAGETSLPAASDLTAFDLSGSVDPRPSSSRPALAGLTQVSLSPPRAASQAARKLRATARMVLLIGGLSVVTGLWGGLSQDPALRASGIGFGVAIAGALFLPLAYRIQRRSTAALWIAITLVAADTVLSAAAAIRQEGSPWMGGLVVRILVLRMLWQGFDAIRELNEEEHVFR